MFLSSVVKNTREPKIGDNINILDFAPQFEVTDMVENLDIDQYNRNKLSDFGPDPINLASDQPRRNTFSRQIINLHHYGAFEPSLPYVGSTDYDTQFHDHDPRGYSEDQNWQKFRKLREPTLKQTKWYPDSDYSLPSGGAIHPTDMQLRLSELRKMLRSRVQWFQDSLGNFIVSPGNNPNSPKFTNVELMTTEDPLDPTITDAVGRMNTNSIASNNINLGGKYYINRTTTDQILPTASYNFVFEKSIPNTFATNTGLMVGDHKITTLDPNQGTKNFVKYVDKRLTKKLLENEIKYNKGLTNFLFSPSTSTTSEAGSRAGSNSDPETQKYNDLLERQNSPNQVLNKDILALVGITDNEMKFIKSLETTNYKAYKECIGNLYDMAIILEKLPPLAKENLRNQLFTQRTKEYLGGDGTLGLMSGKNNIKNILSSNNSIVPNKVGKNIDNITTDQKNSKKYENFQNSVKSNEIKHLPSKVESYNFLNSSNQQKRVKSNYIDNTNKGQIEDEIINESLHDKNHTNTFLGNRNHIKNLLDNDHTTGPEHVRNDELLPVSAKKKLGSLMNI